MTRVEMDKLNYGDRVEVKSYNTTTEEYEWIPTKVTEIYECTNGDKFAHGGRYSVYAKINGFTVCLDPELTRVAQ